MNGLGNGQVVFSSNDVPGAGSVIFEGQEEPIEALNVCS